MGRARVPHALTLIQPAATLAAHGIMPRPVLAWGTDYRGPLHIASAIKYDDINRSVCNSPSYAAALQSIGYGRGNPLPMGSFVGAATLVDCRRVEPADPGPIPRPLAAVRVALNPGLNVEYEEFGRYLYIWEFTDFVVLDPPRVGRTSPGIYRAPAHVAACMVAEGRPAPPPGTILEPIRTVLQDGTLICGIEHDRREGRPLYQPRPMNVKG
jgi:hypothetical protein